MGAAAFSLGAVRIVWNSLSEFSLLPSIFQTDGQNWLVITLCISNWVNCMGPPCARICDQTDILRNKFAECRRCMFFQIPTYCAIYLLDKTHVKIRMSNPLDCPDRQRSDQPNTT